MSFGHKRHQAKSMVETLRILGENDTPELLALTYRVDHSCDWPYGGGNSVDGRTIYIDRTLYAEVMSGKVYVRGMTGRQIIRAWCTHEHIEWSVEMGDNASDDYLPSHGFATAGENDQVSKLGINSDRYEDCIEPALKRCIKRFIKLDTKASPPKDVWCGPVLDDPDADDKQIIRILRAKGVEDAFKVSKPTVDYGMGPEECRDCAMFGDRNIHPDLRKCDLVCGLVRANRHCIKWTARK